MFKLWQKNTKLTLNKEIENFTTSNDHLLDLKLVKYEIFASLAHGKMLLEIGILKEKEWINIKKILKEIFDKNEKGNFIIEAKYEDIHTKIENILTEKLGNTGKKIHTGRSRNDQILVDLRLYSKSELLKIKSKIIDLSKNLLTFATEYEFIPFPGYTHMQLGMPSSLGMWAGSFVENFIDELNLLEAINKLNDQCPLGSGAGYGIPLKLNRKLTQKLLGFERMQINSMYCCNSRGKIEANIISVLVSISLVINKMTSDLLLFTTKEFNFFNIKEELTTGSSIMPQKKNIDVFELIRAKTSALIGMETSIKNLISNLPSGYHRDFQDTKELLINSFDTITPCINLMNLSIKKITPKETEIIKAHKQEIYATDIAYKMLEKEIPFREAYIKAASEIKNFKKIEKINPYEIIKTKKSLGSTGNLSLKTYKNKLNLLEIEVNQAINKINNTFNNLWQTSI